MSRVDVIVRPPAYVQSGAAGELVKRIGTQWQREFAKSIEAGHRGRVSGCACAMVGMSPGRRWRWQQALRLLSGTRATELEPS